MKLLTLLIFSGDRLHIKDLLSDISKLNQQYFDVKIIDWTENKKILKEKKKIYLNFKKKLIRTRIIFQKGSYESKYAERRTKFYFNIKSKYVLLISDDDRLNLKNFPKIFKYLNYNLSGITLSFKNFKNYKDLNKKEPQKKLYIRNFNLYSDLHRIGFISCQIIKTDLIKKIFKEEKKNLLISQFPHNFIIIKIIKDFKNWKIINLNCIFNRVGNLKFYLKNSEAYLDRLNSEYLGYFLPIKKNFLYLKRNQLDKIYKIIFFKNIVSWLFLSIKHCGKEKTYKKIKNSRNIIREPFIIKFVHIIFYISPILLLDFLRILRKIYNFLRNN